jgi:hypothetical protein
MKGGNLLIAEPAMSSGPRGARARGGPEETVGLQGGGDELMSVSRSEKPLYKIVCHAV